MNADEVRAEVAGWLAENWNPDRPLAEWRDILVDSGWGCPTWPAEWFGKGLPPRVASVVDTEFSKVGAVGIAPGQGITLAAATILEHGSDHLKATFLKPAATGKHRWCQLFSEPGNGSDLAGLTTRAERDGDEWVINGQKVWNTSAHKADFGMLVARTNVDVPKHKGITYFIIDMHQPGVEVRPLREMTGRAMFNEVFLTEARVSDANIVGTEGEGWRATLTTLASERFLPSVRTPSSSISEDPGRCREEAMAEAKDYFSTYVWYPQRAGRADLLVRNAQESGRVHEAVIRDRLGQVTSLDQTARWTAKRAQAAAKSGRAGPEGSIGKLVGSEIARQAAALHGSIAGAHAMLNGPDSPLDGLVAEIIVSQPGQSIAGGTDQIQRNIIGEKALGLPREPAVDIDIPFRDVRTNTSRR